MTMRTLTYFIFSLSLLITTGCTDLFLLQQPKPTTPPPIQKTISNFEQRAIGFETQGNYYQAAQEYLNLAASVHPPHRQTYQLRAVNAYLAGDMLTEAKTELSKIDIQQSFGLNIPLKFTHARIALKEGRLSGAAAELNAINANALPTPLLAEYHQLNAQLYDRKGDAFAALNELIYVENLLGRDQLAIQQNHQYIWQILSRQSSSQLQQIQQVQGDVLSGWISLALLTKSTSPRRLSMEVSNWQRSFPRHPANLDIARDLIVHGNQAQQTNLIALLLPTNSNYKAVAQAIQHGFSAALYEDGQPVPPQFVVINTTKDNVLQAYQDAASQGATAIVGPLEKDAVEILLSQPTLLTVPTLTLNYVNYPVPVSNLYQFGLSAENEAREIALRAWNDGHRTSIMLVPESNLGTRVAEAFQTAWQALGGQMLAVEFYGDNKQSAVKELLKRGKQANMAFMMASPLHGRELRPFFSYYYAPDMPIYSTSHIYAGTPAPELDTEIDGVIFGDMPWVLSPDQQALKIQASLQQTLPELVEQFIRFFALGFDAYHLAGRMDSLGVGFQYPGQTGFLTLEPPNVIYRNLQWARFVDGMPRPFNE